MADQNSNQFLPEFLAVAYGKQFPGVIPLWNKQTKMTRRFAANEISSLITTVEKDKSSLDLYIGSATQSADFPVGKRGSNATVAQVGAFFLDIDFATEKTSTKNYPKDEEEALKILDAFSFQPTLIQYSGGGLHSIYVMKEPMICHTHSDRESAQHLLKAFQREISAHFKSHGREIDDCSDLARLYRVPLSYNHKYDVPRLVEVRRWDPEARIDISALKLAETIQNRKLERRDHPPADHALIRENCSWYAHQTGDGAATASEPEWTAAGSTTAACEGGREIFHEYSKTHVKYRYRAAELKFDHIEAHVSPFRCSTIRESYGGEQFCAGCPFWMKVKSPVQLGDARQIMLIEQRAASASEGWADFTKDGRPRATFRNAIRCLIRLDVEIRYDLFRMRISVAGLQVQEFAGDMNDDALAYLRKKAADAFGFDPGKTNIGDAAHTIALENAFHPIRDYLDGLIWDRRERLPRLLVDYFSAEDTALNRAFAVSGLVAAVRRVRNPGTKFDTILVLEGPQGSGKSTAIAILAGEGNFSDQAIIGQDQKVQGELLGGVWLYEVAELSGLRHADINDLKSFLSRDTDRFRAAYARFTSDYPRQCIFIGTTNDDTYLKDTTGNRRFWPVRTGRIDLKALAADRDQLWAEAAYLEAQGHSVTLPEALWEEAARLQASRMPPDPWLDTLENINGATVTNGEERISTDMLFGSDNLGIPVAQRKDYHVKHLARLMVQLGWTGPASIRIGGRTQRGYARKVGADHPGSSEF